MLVLIQCSTKEAKNAPWHEKLECPSSHKQCLLRSVMCRPTVMVGFAATQQQWTEDFDIDESKDFYHPYSHLSSSPLSVGIFGAVVHSHLGVEAVLFL